MKKGFIAIGLPSPDKVKGSKYEPDDEDTSDEEDSEDKDAEHAAKVSAMGDFLKALGLKHVDAEQALSAYEDLMEHCE